MAHFNDIVFNIIGIVQNIINRWRIKRCTFQLNHVVLAAHKWREAVGITAALALLHTFGGDVARAETQQRHGFHTEGGDHDFARLAVGNGQAVLTDDFHDNQLGMHMAALAKLTLREGGAHLRRRIGGKELHIPFLLDFATQQVEFEILISQALTDANDTADAAVFIVDVMLLGILYQL